MDPVIEFLKEEAGQQPWIRRMILFGSRARGDHHARSDYDLAIETLGEIENSGWAAWCLSMQDQVPTLCGLDLVLITQDLGTDLKRAIQEEGQTVYEKQK